LQNKAVSLASNTQPREPGHCIHAPQWQLHPQAPGSLFVVSYDSQGYGWVILTRLHTGIQWDEL
jgi:hypothetical protein